MILDQEKIAQQFWATLCKKCPNMEVFSGLYIPVSGLHTRKYRPEKTPYLDIFCAVLLSLSAAITVSAVCLL